jgi:putative transposase
LEKVSTSSKILALASFYGVVLVLDKPLAWRIGLVASFWLDRHRPVVRGINLISLVWTDDRLVDPAQRPKQTKNDLFADLVRQAPCCGICPQRVAFDSWYSGKENMKAVRGDRARSSTSRASVW